jgi:hypothetical protein
MNIVHVLDELDPITYGYPIFYDGHAGFKIINDKSDNLNYVSNNELTPYENRSEEESIPYYKKKQYDTNDQDLKNYQDATRRQMNAVKSGIHSLVSPTVRQTIQDVTNTLSKYGTSHHSTAHYAEIINRVPESHTFIRGVVQYKNLFTDIKPYEGAVNTRRNLLSWLSDNLLQIVGTRMPIHKIEIDTPMMPMYKQPSQILADYVTPDMLVNGFIFYDENTNAKHENNFISY